jgi:hypothetical protein
VEEEEHKKPYSIWFYLYEILRKGKALKTESRSGCQGLGTGVRTDCKQAYRNLFRNGLW